MASVGRVRTVGRIGNPTSLAQPGGMPFRPTWVASVVELENGNLFLDAHLGSAQE